MLCYLLDVNHACSTSISYLSLSPVIGALLEIEQDLIRPTNGSSDFSLSDLRNILTRLWTVAESQRSSFSSFRGSKVEWIHVSRLCDLKRPGELSGPTKCQKAGTKTQSGTKFKVSSAISKWVLTSHIFLPDLRWYKECEEVFSCDWPLQETTEYLRILSNLKSTGSKSFLCKKPEGIRGNLVTQKAFFRSKNILFVRNNDCFGYKR